MVPRRVQGGGLLFAEVVLGVVNVPDEELTLMLVGAVGELRGGRNCRERRPAAMQPRRGGRGRFRRSGPPRLELAGEEGDEVEAEVMAASARPGELQGRRIDGDGVGTA